MANELEAGTMGKLVYFISDLHLGASYIADRRRHEQSVVRWLEEIGPTAEELILLGDVLDYWYEYRTVVPRGFVRFFGALARLADSGVKITWFIGNHDIWIFDYLPREIGVRVIDGVEEREIMGKRFFLTHGDAVGKLTPGFRFIRSMFRNRFCQWLYGGIHPRWSVAFAHRWSSSSRESTGSEPDFRGAELEPQVKFAMEYSEAHPEIDYYVMGHRHILLDYPLNGHARLIILGDWIKNFSYGTFDGEEFRLHRYAVDPALRKEENSPQNIKK